MQMYLDGGDFIAIVPFGVSLNRSGSQCGSNPFFWRLAGTFWQELYGLIFLMPQENNKLAENRGNNAKKGLISWTCSRS
jgi:hypothetical protein